MSSSIFDKVYNKFEEAASKAKDNKIIKKKADLIFKTLISYQEKYNESQDFLENQLDNLNDLFSKLSKLSDQISNDSIQNSILFSLRDGKKIEQIIIDINASMNDITASLRAMGVTDLTEFPTDTFSQDIYSVHEYLDEIFNKVQQRKKETKQMLNICTDNLNLNNESTINILERYKKDYEKEFQYPKTKNFLYYSDDQYYYFEGTYGGEKIMLMRIEDNHKIGRILDVFAQLDYKYVEKFIGFSIENKNENEEPTILIGTKRNGTSLFDIFHKKKSDNSGSKAKLEDRTILIYKIIQAMIYIHSRNIIHRNLTMSSINVCYNENDEVYPIIVNFKSSRPMPSKSYDINMTQYDKEYDTSPTFFFAPEYYNGTIYDESIDVFSFAGIMYELATGKAPFDKKSMEEVKRLMIEGKEGEEDKYRPSLVKLRKDNPDLANLIENCWKQNPKQRYTFSQILKEMSEKNIVFPKDKQSAQKIKDFYKAATRNEEKIKDCLVYIDSIKKGIRNAYQYRYELYSIISFLNDYQNFLQEYKPPNKSNKNIDILLSKLPAFSKLVSSVSYENFKDSKANEIEVGEITNGINKFMGDINNLMKELGYSSNEQFQESEEDVIYDFHELCIIFSNKEDLKGKFYDIKDFLGDAKWRKVMNMSKEITSKRITNLLSKFKRYDCSDFLQNSIKNSSSYLDEDDEPVNYNDIGIGHNDDKDKGIINREKKSTVYEGRTSTGDAPMIIKIFDFPTLQNEKNCIMIQKEIEDNSKIDLKYISKLVGYAFDEQKCNVWLLIESVNDVYGQLLKNQIPKLSNELKKNISFKLADLFKYLSSLKIDHRDITTSSIIIDGGNPKLIDLGDESQNDYALSFSKILYEMLTGKEAPKESNFKFDGEYNEKSELQKLIELGFQTDQKCSFDDMFNRMNNYKDHLDFSNSI